MRSTILAAATVIFLGANSAGAADPICGDVNLSGSLTTTDALVVLKKSVGQQVTLQCLAPGLLVKTGQTQCSDTAGAAIDCAGTAQDGETLRGLAISFTDKGDGTIVDNKTGLQWEKLDDDNKDGVDGIHDWDLSYTWADAPTKLALLNKISFAGFTDWRLPNMKELASLVNYDLTSPAVGAQFNNGCEADCTTATCSCGRPEFYWSSSSYAFDASYGWGVNFLDGSTVGSDKAGPNYIRAVRGGS